MIGILRKKLQRLLNLGVETEPNFVVRSIVTVCNAGYLFVIVAITIAMIFYAALGLWNAIALSLIPMAAFLGLLILNYRGHFNLSRVLCTSLANSCILFGIHLLGNDIGIHLFIFPLLFCTFVIFRSNETALRLISLVPSLAILATVEFGDHWFHHPVVDLSMDQESFMRIAFLIGAILLSCLPSLVQSSMLENYRGKLEMEEQERLQTSKLAALGEMSAGIAHEINNPLTSIAGRAELITTLVKDKLKDNREIVLKMSQEIQKNSDRISKIVLGLRSFSRDSSKDKLEPYSIDYILDETLTLCQQRIRNHEIELNIIRNEFQYEVFSRPYEISQVFLNLINNSIDALNEFPHRLIEIDQRENGSDLEVTIRDSGPGISRTLKNRVLQPFFTTKALGKGTGLGLSISKGIMEKHGGQLVIRGEGPTTCFVLCFPKNSFRKAKRTNQAVLKSS